MREAGRRWTGALVALGVVMTACSGGGGDGSATSEPDSPDSTAVDDDSSAAEESPTSSEAPPPADTSPSRPATSTTSTTTTVPPPAILPLGTVWTPALLDTGASTTPTDLVTIGDELWTVGTRWNGPVAWRTADGISWTEVPIQGPPDSGALGVSGIVGRPDGGYLAWGSAGSDCQVSLDRDNGYRETGLCRRFRPVVFLSDDGAAWRRVDPPSMQPGGGAAIVIDSLTAVSDGFVAVGTHRSRDWYAMIWFSPDGENWELVRDLRGVDGPMSGHEVHWDGSTIVLLTHEHPCSQNDVNDNTPGWILGAQWANHLRMFAGPNVRDLAPLAPDDHPIVEPPMAVDCSVDDAFFLAQEPYPDARGEVIGGRITLVDETPPPQVDGSTGESESTGEEEPTHPRRLVSLVDGEWIETLVEGHDRAGDQLVEVDGGPALLRTSRPGDGRTAIEILVPGAAGGDWDARTSDRPIIGELVRHAVGFGDSVVTLSRSFADPFTTSRSSDDPVELLAWSSRDVAEDDVSRCVPAAGEVCRAVVFSALEGYPDFSGADFGGADLMFAEFGTGDYSGASFAGSNLAGTTVDPYGGDPSFVGADLSGADLRGAALEDVAGANFAGADLTAASIGFSELPASLDGAILTNAVVEVVRGPDGEYPTLELSLAGYDLTRSRIRGPLGGEVRLVVTDLRGAVLDGTSFYAVDLTGVQLDEGVDLADVDVWDNSLCPDGQPPTGGGIGTCFRGEEADG